MILAPVTAPIREEPPSAGPVDLGEVALVCLPFASATMPSIQIGVMTAVAEHAGCRVDPYHFNLDLAAVLNPERYEQLCAHRGRMTGEWLFAVAAFGEAAVPPDQDFLTAFPDEARWLCDKVGLDGSGLADLRHEVLPGFIDMCLDAVNWSKYKVVGFTSTFQQNVASLALARRIKERHPGPRIVFGGANMEHPMGEAYVRAFEFLDYAVVGEGEVAFPELLRSLACGRDPDVTGVVRRTGAEVVSKGQASPLLDLNATPIPRYDEFFERARQFGLKPLPRLPFETSRGCWWGFAHHCTFCGLNGLGMRYRMKSVDRVFTEIDELSRRYRIQAFDATDNILAPKFVGAIFDKIYEDRTDYHFFFEVKANLTREQLRTMVQGGVRRLQPGIESLSTHILDLMRKGTTMLQNVCLLKWCRYYGIRVNWNVLCGFPGETSEDYENQLKVLRQLPHLEPPSGLSRIWLERFSPYFVDRKDYPIREISPEPSYSYAYPNTVALEDAAYFFTYSMDEVVADEDLYATDDWIREWRQRWGGRETTDTLSYERSYDAVLVHDARGRKSPLTYIFDGPLGVAYEYCSDSPRTVPEVARWLADQPTAEVSTEEEMRKTLDVFCEAGLMLYEDGSYLSLALPENPNW